MTVPFIRGIYDSEEKNIINTLIDQHNKYSIRYDGISAVAEEVLSTAESIVEANKNFELAERGVSATKTTFLIPKKNLFNKATRGINGYISSDDGMVKNNKTFDYSDWIYVEGGKVYILNVAGQWAEYDQNKQFIRGHNTSEAVTLDSNTSFVRISVRKGDIDRVQFEQNNEKTLYEPYILELRGNELEPISIPSSGGDNGSGGGKSGKFSILGDSISTFEGWVPEGNRSRYPSSNLLEHVDGTWWKRLIDRTDLELGVNESWAGSRLVWNGTTEGADYGVDKHIASEARINKLGNNGNPDYIFFFGGTNDIRDGVSLGEFVKGDYTTLPVQYFSEAYSTAIIRMQNRYPNAEIICMTPMFSRESTQYTASDLEEYINSIEMISNYFGCRFVDMRKCGINLFNVDSHLPDGLHPGSSGFELMADYLIDVLHLN